MVIWTPEEWGKELNEFASATNGKKFNKIPYGDWKMMWHWQYLPSETDIYLKLKDNSFMFSPYGKSDYITLVKDDANWPFIEYLQSKYYLILDWATSCYQRSVTNLNRLYLYMSTNYAIPSSYEVTSAKTVASNSDLATATANTALNTNYCTIWTDTIADSRTYYPSNGIYSPNYATQSEVDKIKAQIENIKTNISENKKEKKDMNFFKNFEFGPIKNDNVRLSPYGLAVKNLDDSWVSYDAASDSIIDVDVFNFEGKNLIYKIPAAPHAVRAGDMIVHQGKGMYVLTDVCEGDTCVSVIDPRAGESKEILFTKSPFGFTFVTKLVSLLDMSGINANTDSPFGNLLPLALMGDKDCDAATMMAFMMMNNSEGCNFDMSNPMMMYALMSGENKDMLLPMMLMAGRK